MFFICLWSPTEERVIHILATLEFPISVLFSPCKSQNSKRLWAQTRCGRTSETLKRRFYFSKWEQYFIKKFPCRKLFLIAERTQRMNFTCQIIIPEQLIFQGKSCAPGFVAIREKSNFARLFFLFLGLGLIGLNMSSFRPFPFVLRRLSCDSPCQFSCLSVPSRIAQRARGIRSVRCRRSCAPPLLR